MVWDEGWGKKDRILIVQCLRAQMLWGWLRVQAGMPEPPTHLGCLGTGGTSHWSCKLWDAELHSMLLLGRREASGWPGWWRVQQPRAAAPGVCVAGAVWVTAITAAWELCLGWVGACVLTSFLFLPLPTVIPLHSNWDMRFSVAGAPFSASISFVLFSAAAETCLVLNWIIWFPSFSSHKQSRKNKTWWVRLL